MVDEGHEPVELVKFAHERLRSAILANRLAPSASFSQAQLARELGVSRTPVREAVRLLEHEGLAMVEFNRRVRVADLSADDLDSLYAMRILLEGLALHVRATGMGAEQLAASRLLLEEMETAGRDQDIDAWSRHHRAFHLDLVLGDGGRTDRQIEHDFDHAERYRRVFLGHSEAHWRRAACEHAAILDACEARDGAAAARRLAEHYATTARGVLAVIDPDFVPARMTRALTMVTALVFAD